MLHRPSDRHRAGFTGLFVTEVAVVTLLYALYPCAVFSFTSEMPRLREVPALLIVLVPVAVCFALPACYLVWLNHRDAPDHDFSVSAAAHTLLFVLTLVLFIASWLP